MILANYFIQLIINEDNWGPWAFLITTLLILIFLEAKKIEHVRIGPKYFFVVYFFLNAIYHFAVYPYVSNDDEFMRAAHQGLSAMTAMQFTALILFYQMCFSTYRKKLANIFLFVGVINAVLMTLGFKGLFGNVSMSASFSSLWIILTFYMGLPLLSLIGLIPIILAKSSISILAVLAGATVLLRPRWYYVAASMLPIGGLAYYFDFNNSRFAIWPELIIYWWQKFNMFFGSGPGTFQLYYPMVEQVREIRPGRFWPWAHSDWLQIWLCLGHIGLLLAISCFAVMIYRVKNLYLKAMCVSLAVIMLGNYPFRVSGFALFAMFIIYETATVSKVERAQEWYTAQMKL